MIEPVRLLDDAVELLDQRLLPREERYVRCADAAAVAAAIKEMVVRGAPAIGVAAAGGVALAALAARERPAEGFLSAIDAAVQEVVAARPTAVNPRVAAKRVASAAREALEAGDEPAAAAAAALAAARAVRDEDLAANQEMGKNGAMLVPDGARILTHCNAGALATAGFGTALGVVRAAVAEGKKVSVVADETRPWLQGARLTAWELQKDEIPTTLISDNMAGALMARGEIDLVVVGADRIALNGDVANKIGTYMVAVLARRHGVPFYVVAPTATIDADCPEGAAIPIEERDPEEVLSFAGQRVAPEGIEARHIAFDVTPAELVTAIVTEKGIHRAPFARSLAHALGIEDEAPAPAAEDGAAPEAAPADSSAADGEADQQ